MSKDAQRIIDRLRALNKAVEPTNPVVKAALTRIGVILQAQTKLNVRRQGLIDSSRLINSIKYFVSQADEKAVLRVGSFGVPYAATHEFGFDGIQQVRAFSRVSRSGKEHDVKAHTRQMRIPERPFLRPAIKQHRDRVIEIIRKAALNA